MPRSAAIVEARKIIPIPLVTIHGLDPGYGGPHSVPAGLPRRTAIPPVPRRQRREPKSVRPSPAPARSGPPAATSALYWTRVARLGLPIPSVRQRALLGARPPLAKTQSPMRPRTPRRTRRSKRISLRSLSFVAGEKCPGCNTLISRQERLHTHRAHGSRFAPYGCGLFLWSVPPWGRNARKGTRFRQEQKIYACLPGGEPLSPAIGKMLLRSMPGPESVLAEAFFEGPINNVLPITARFGRGGQWISLIVAVSTSLQRSTGARQKLALPCQRVAHDGFQVVEMRLPLEQRTSTIGSRHNLCRVSRPPAGERDLEVDARDALYSLDHLQHGETAAVTAIERRGHATAA